MISIAIIDDCEDDRKLLTGYCEKYQAEKGISLKIHEFSSGLNFIEDYEPIYDAIFLDISMPHMNGMDVARKLREKDETVTLIFLTSLAKYAVEGYEVNARMFLLKPLSYLRLSIEMDKILQIQKQQEQNSLVLNTGDGVMRILTKEVYFLQSDKHYVVFHTEHGNIRVRGRLSDFEKMLDENHFIRCNNSCVVHLDYIRKINSELIEMMDNSTVSISRSHKKDFLNCFAKSLGGIIL